MKVLQHSVFLHIFTGNWGKKWGNIILKVGQIIQCYFDVIHLFVSSLGEVVLDRYDYKHSWSY